MQPFIVPLSGLASGRTDFRWHAGGQFFSGFENSEILDADLVVSAVVDKSGIVPEAISRFMAVMARSRTSMLKG